MLLFENTTQVLKLFYNRCMWHLEILPSYIEYNPRNLQRFLYWNTIQLGELCIVLHYTEILLNIDQIHVPIGCVYLWIFRLPTSQSRKLIQKANSKWECPYFYSNYFFKSFGQYLKKVNNGFTLVFSKSDLTSVGSFFTNFFWTKPNTPNYA